MPGRPGGLIAICVIAIVLGGGGLLTGLFQVVSLVAGKQLNELMTRSMAGPQAELQQEMTTKMNTVVNRWKPVLVPLTVAQLAVAGSLLAGAIMTLAWLPAGRKLLSGTMLAGIAFELIRIAPTVMIQMQTQAITKEYMGQLMRQQPGGAGGAAAGNAMASAFVLMTIVFAVGWLLVKVVYYAISARYLRKPELAAKFSTPVNTF